MENLTKWVVRNIIGEDVNGYSRITIASNCFNAVKGFRPLLPYTAMGDASGNGVRVFKLGETELYASYDKESRKTVYLMKTEDAKSHLLTLVQERANNPKLPFDVMAFDRSVVATA